jgi:hypothetical protein
MPKGPAFGGPPEYDDLCLAFRQILTALPAIDEFRVEDRPLEYDEVGQMRFRRGPKFRRNRSVNIMADGMPVLRLVQAPPEARVSLVGKRLHCARGQLRQTH